MTTSSTSTTTAATLLLVLQLLEGVLAFGVSFVVYTISLATRGKRSLAHGLFYTHLNVFRPTRQCVELISGMTNTTTNGTARSHNDDTEGMVADDPPRNPKTVEERLAALEFSSTRIPSGMVAVTAMKTNKETAMGWKHLERVTCLVFGSSLAHGFVRLFVILQLQQQQQLQRRLHCDPLSFTHHDTEDDEDITFDFKCWKDWFLLETDSKFILIVSWLMTLHIVSKLGARVSQLPMGSSLRYAPSSYMTGWIFFLGCMTVSYYHHYHSNYYGTPTTSPVPGVQLSSAVQELAVRIVLWTRLLGIRLDNNNDENDDAVVVTSVSFYLYIMLTFLASYIGFVLAESISSTVQLMVYRYYSSGVSKTTTTTKSKKKTIQQTVFLYMPSALIVMTITISFLILMSFVMNWQSLRYILLCMTCISLFGLMRPLLQTHLDRSLPVLKQVILESKNNNVDDNEATLSSEKILQPFQSRYQRLVDTGSKLMVFPTILMILVALLSLCSSGDLIYPVPYGGPLAAATITSQNNSQAFLKQKVMQITTSSSWRSILQDQESSSTNSQQNDNVHQTTIFPNQINTPLDLLILPLDIPIIMTVAEAISNVQAKSKKHNVVDHDNNNRHVNNNNNNKSNKNDQLKITLSSIWHHPFLTSTIARPILDFLLFLISVWWFMSLMLGFALASSIRQEIQTYAFQVQEFDKSK